jgi:hypothetical protein
LEHYVEYVVPADGTLTSKSFAAAPENRRWTGLQVEQ